MKNVKKLLVLLMAIMMMFCMSAMVFAEDEPLEGEETITGRIIPYGLYEPDQTLLYESSKIRILCERVHVTDVITAEIAITSTNYTELKMNGDTYTPYVGKAGGKDAAIFMVPIKLGQTLTFSAHTTAMGGKDIDYTMTNPITLDKDNLKPAVRGELQDGYYTTSVSTKKATWGWRIYKEALQIGYSYPSNDYELPVTIKVEGGKIADVAYTRDPNEVMMNTSSDFNYLLWAMNGHDVEEGYAYLSKEGANYDQYHVSNPGPAKCGTGMKAQLVGKSDIAGVDTITAATITSRAIIDSVDKSLTKAERGQKDDPEPVLPTPDTSEDIIPADGVYMLETVDAVGLDIDNEVAPTILYVTDGKITAEIGIEQRQSSYPYFYPGSEADALAAGQEAWYIPADYDYGYKYTGSLYKNVPVKSLDKPQHVVSKSKSSGNWFNRLLTFSSEGMVRIPQEADKNLYTEESYSAAADAFANFIAVRDNSESKKADILAAKEALIAAVDALEREAHYTATEDDGERKNQNNISNNVVYSGIGMFRILDKGTSVTKNEDGTVTVKIKTNPLSSGTYEKIALTDYPSGTADEVKAFLDPIAIDADKIEESQGQNGQTGEPATVYSSEFTFTISADEVGKMIPFTYTQNGTWRTKGYYLIVLTDAEVAARQEVINKVEEATTEANTVIEAADKINAADYSEESYAAVTAAEEALKEVLANPKATEEEIAAAKAALENAIAGLKPAAAPEKPDTKPVVKKANPMKVKAVKKTFKVKVLKKKAKTFKAVKVTGNKGKLSYVGKPVGKKAKKYLKFNKKTGKITVKKGAKKGKYKMKVTVKAAGNASYKAGKKTVTVVVTVKK